MKIRDDTISSGGIVIIVQLSLLHRSDVFFAGSAAPTTPIDQRRNDVDTTDPIYSYSLPFFLVDFLAMCTRPKSRENRVELKLYRSRRSGHAFTQARDKYHCVSGLSGVSRG